MSAARSKKTADLEFLGKRLEKTDLIPSQRPLLDGLSQNLSALENAGIHDLDTLRKRVKTAASRAALSEVTGVSPEYLNLLRRTVEGLFPKPRPLSEFHWLKKETLGRLETAGLKTTHQVFEAGNDWAEKARKAKLAKQEIQEIQSLSDLCRVQWVSPSFAGALFAAGFETAEALCVADPEAVHAAVLKANENARFFRGSVGLRDIRRLVAAAEYVF